MLEVLHEATSDADPCAYLPEQEARMRYRLVERCSPDDYRQLLERGWRRFGKVFFRPACASCRECRSLRVDVDSFRRNRSMERAWRANQDLRVVLQPASLSRQHLELYARYHADMAVRRGWSERAIEAAEYHHTFIAGGGEHGHELLYFLGPRLVAVALVDIVPGALSAVYCYYEPGHRKRSLGVFSILAQIELARRRRMPFVYLGFWIEGNTSMRYKARYRPHQILDGRPSAEEIPRWLPDSARQLSSSTP